MGVSKVKVEMMNNNKKRSSAAERNIDVGRPPSSEDQSYLSSNVKAPHDMDKIAGGSSGGSAALVAAGLCAVALGVDGGGSVRMPAALCGVIGFKATFGRVPHSGVLPLNWTVGMVGVLAGTVEDALIVYSAIAGEMKTLDRTKELKIKSHGVVIIDKATTERNNKPAMKRK